ncbi:MAG: sodium:proton antiporter [Acetobacteraceae bacterium]
MPASAAAAAIGQAAAASAPGLAWGIPFVGVLASIALGPTVAPSAWRRFAGLAMAIWSVALIAAQAATGGTMVAEATLGHAVLEDYVPFVSLLLALYVCGGGILLRGGPWGRPAGNALLLTIGTLLASVIGTTGASMVLVHPLLRANEHRRQKGHLLVFFIVLVANVGGALSPIGDPPIYMGFLQGVPFFWPTSRLLVPVLLVAAPVIGAFYVLDRCLASREPGEPRAERLRLDGIGNLALIGVVVAAVAGLGSAQLGSFRVAGQSVPLDRLASAAVCLAVTGISVLATPAAVRRANIFTWHPIREVAEIFAAIFITVVPVLAMLHAGREGPLSGVVGLVANGSGAPVPAAYFWAAGLLSSVLDNAPTYLVFFGLAGGDAARLTGPLARTLVAISAGSVFFGGLTYIGNAPNMMVRAIAEHRGVRAPGFFGYSAAAAAILVLPLLLVTLLVL